MKNYLEFNFKISPFELWNEILMAELIEIGFDSFMEENDRILGYIQTELFREEHLKALPVFENKNINIEYSFAELPDINWNEEWEKNFLPVTINDKVQIRAEFHPSVPEIHEIIIQPKMSFGTGHHPTTHLMIQQMTTIDFNRNKVLDMGCGTSVLAIYAKQRGAEKVKAMDMDKWSVENSQENAVRNKVDIEVEQGTAENLGPENYDIILANINRNILISDIPTYVSVLKKGGKLILSGICFFDVQDIMDVCLKSGMNLKKQLQREEWVSLLLEK